MLHTAGMDSPNALFDIYDAHEAPRQPVPSSRDDSSHLQYNWKGCKILPGELHPSLPAFLLSNTPGSFFSRCAAAHHQYISHIESPRQKAVRLILEMGVPCYLINKKSHDKVYKWDFNDHVMHWECILVPQHEHMATWVIYPSKCKCYDSVAREWDLAWFLDHGEPELSTINEYNTLDDGKWDCQDMSSHHLCPFFHEKDNQLSLPPPSSERPKGNSWLMSTSSMVEYAAAQQSVAPPPQDHAIGLGLESMDDEPEVPNTVRFLEVMMGFHGF